MARPREFDEERVLDAVMETFWQHGYEATSAQDLVDATGLGRGSLYAAYTSKNGLFDRALLHYNKHSRENAERLRVPGSSLDRLRELLLGVIDEDLKGPERRGCLATNSAIERAGRDPHVAGLVRHNFQIMSAGIRDAILRGQKAGEIRTGRDAESLALYVFNAMQGLRVLARITPQQERGKLVAVVEQTLEGLS